METHLQPAPGLSRGLEEEKINQIFVYGHSALFYWWPLWAAGYVMALLTWLDHERVDIDEKTEWFHPNRNFGVMYTLLLLFLILVTSIKIKGMKSALIVAGLSFLALLLVYLGWWNPILRLLGEQSISLNIGFYLFFSTALFLSWLISVFVVDHTSCWRFRPGQVTHEYLWQIGTTSYDTDNMTISLNRQDDFFRHWIIGLGSGDLHLQTMGGKGVQIDLANVLFVGAKMDKIQRMIATKPDMPQKA